ncbi:probable E3 ubiquitin-protein ligase HERC6 isoform X2 [Microcaecilia unicolor]|uniref:Probable E3 ubiquitin-protein ligase HERC6 isoform X2 n=1 Tax=Microcaecilia unicolor TaxID=1415580 RepID=A0A6P7X8T9_9AMPH|nr:probable E3 ubiquitin-protein ligase HERC6 isoform X2 [Microcaecilia unicolor]
MYWWGSGCPGLKEEETPEEAVGLRRLPQGQRVLEVGCSGGHCLFLLDDGTVTSCGHNQRGQLGRRNQASGARTGQIQALEAQSIVHVSCGKEHSLAVCSRGHIFAWGAGSEGQLGIGQFKEQSLIPKRIDGIFNVKVIQVTCGHYHSIALLKDGRVFSWGQNNHGQLGLGKGINSQASPQRVTSLEGIPLAQVAAGGAHSFALSLSGAVFGWGRNIAGQLGFNHVGQKAGQFKPYSVAALQNLGAIYISCGDEHTAVLTRDGSVFTFGDNAYGQLGHSPTSQSAGPQKIEIDGLVSQIACGSYHTLAFVFTSGQIVSVGRGHFDHVAACDETRSLPEPHTRTFDISSLISANDLEGIHVKRIFAGGCTNFVTTFAEPRVVAFTDIPLSAENLQKIGSINRTSVERWVAAKTGSEERLEAKREIVLIFSSAACLTGSFIQPSYDCPPETSSINVDPKAARETFDELTKQDWIAATISYCLQEHLLPALPSVASYREALSIFLLLPQCSVMHEAEKCVALVIPFADAVNKLSRSSFSTLEKCWSSLQASSLNQIVEMLKRTVVYKFQHWQITLLDIQDLKTVLNMMKKLYKANMKANCILPINKFYIEEINNHVDIYRDVLNWRWFLKSVDSREEDKCPVIVCRFPFVLNWFAKIRVLHSDSLIRKQGAVIEAGEQFLQGSGEFPKLPVFHLRVNRKNFVEDVFQKLSTVEDCNLRMELMVEFVGEPGIDLGGIRRQFFLVVFEEIVQPDYGMFMYCDSFSSMWFPSSPSVEKKKYFLFGILCGLAVFNYTVVYLPFPLALYKKLLDKKVTLEDMKEFQPTIGRSLQYILDCAFDDPEKNPDVYFSIPWDNKEVDLIPNGSSIVVDNSNKCDYVDKYIDYVFNKSVTEIFEAFKRGFYKVCDREILQFFQPQELMEVVTGNTDYDWIKFEKNTIYWGIYGPSHPTIQIFWKVFHELPLPEKKGFLLFLTGLDKVPLLGMDFLKMRITSHATLSANHLPEAQTCFQILFLPLYSTIEVLKEKLLMAISFNKGFGKT